MRKSPGLIQLEARLATSLREHTGKWRKDGNALEMDIGDTFPLGLRIERYPLMLKIVPQWPPFSFPLWWAIISFRDEVYLPRRETFPASKELVAAWKSAMRRKDQEAYALESERLSHLGDKIR